MSFWTLLVPFWTRKIVQNDNVEAFLDGPGCDKKEKEKREEGDWRNVKNVDRVEGKRFF